jgi:hypothetical protein
MSEPSPSIDPQPLPEQHWQAPLTSTSANLTAWLKRELERKEARDAALRAQTERIEAVQEREP